ncbi:uncharacterized protein LOC129629324 isoform X1 [Bubalus kerabau]|uniref:uncharacterized protein LOC129629324 isoform X1 n=1 Tax=Bubalus carabanensis TaxID=3119969 RepID=UPI00244EF59F|nr:uncharacterized protein LOC129629324 isoform X1 [Bubalus carabanensis]
MSSAVKEQEELRVGAPGKNRMCYGRSVIIPMAVVTDSHQLSGSKQHKLNNSLMVLEAGFLPLTRFTWKALELVGHEQLRLLLQRSHILEGPVILVDSLLLSHRGRPQTEMQPLSSVLLQPRAKKRQQILRAHPSNTWKKVKLVLSSTTGSAFIAAVFFLLGCAVGG